MDPLFRNSFFQNCLAHRHTNFELDQTSCFREIWLFLLKIDHFQKSKLSQLSRHWRMSVFNGRYQSIRNTLHYKKVFFYGSIFFVSWKLIIFFLKKWQKGILKIVHFLVNYATFVNDSYSWISWKWLFEYVYYTPKRFYFTLFSLLWRGTWQFSLKNELYMDPLFSKFIFPKSSRASAHQFWARSDQPDWEKWIFLLKIDHF